MEINPKGKLVAGILLVSFSLAAIFFIMGFWPDRTPKIGEGDNAWYQFKLYHIELLGNADKSRPGAKTGDSLMARVDTLKKQQAQLKEKVQTVKDSVQWAKDTATLAQLDKDIKEIQGQVTASPELNVNEPATQKKIHFNSIILILVGLMGFLGNMVHIASSFTTFVGNETFKRSWILWYCVKPFTAAGLAIIVYFIIRAGFINYGSDPGAVNLYGIIAFAAMAGLFTDKATLKLEEIFGVIFKSKDERKDKLEGDLMLLKSVLPAIIDVNAANNVVISGENFSRDKMLIKVNDEVINNAVITETTISFTYNVPVAERSKTSFVLKLIKNPKDIKEHTWKTA